MSDPGALGPTDLERPLAGAPPHDLDVVAAVVEGRPRGATRALWVAAGLVLLVVLPIGLAVGAGWQPLLDLDRSVSDALVVPGRGRDVDTLRVLTGPGGLQVRFVVLLPLVVWLAVIRRWRLVVFVVVAGLGIGALNGTLKLIFGRARPSYEGTIDHAGLSFPSGHSAGTAALAALLVVVAWPLLAGLWRLVWVTVAAVAVIVVGYTRIALGAHFLSDVVAGWSLGIAFVLLLAVALQVWPGEPGALPSRGTLERS